MDRREEESSVRTEIPSFYYDMNSIAFAKYIILIYVNGSTFEYTYGTL